MSESVKEYRIPLMIGAGALVVALLMWALLVAPQNSKLASLQTQETQLQAQQSNLQVKLSSLKTEQQKLSSSCADLQKIATQIPSVQNPTDLAAHESSFENQFNALTARTGVSLTQFSGFTPATTRVFSRDLLSELKVSDYGVWTAAGRLACACTACARRGPVAGRLGHYVNSHVDLTSRLERATDPPRELARMVDSAMTQIGTGPSDADARRHLSPNFQ